MYAQLAVLSEWHIILLAIIAFLLFGGKKLPELARGIGQAMKEFKKASREVDDAIHGIDSSPSNHHVPTPRETDNNTKTT
ncbi:MAG: twin-arginine translocase TatA/TatE family subunit [Verrucomicrobiae bacterium]|nr:twin-arginine translocase TatA/TatE family subunit [Verrucomicrobiae bacterium]